MKKEYKTPLMSVFTLEMQAVMLGTSTLEDPQKAEQNVIPSDNEYNGPLHSPRRGSRNVWDDNDNEEEW